MFGWNAEYEALGDRSAFATQQSSAIVNGLKLTCLAHTPIHTRVDSNELSFFMPVEGGPIHSTVNGDKVECEVMANALVAPEGERIGTGGHRSVLIASLDRQRLWQTARAMLSRDEARLDLDRPSVMPLSAGKVNFDLLLRGACRALDACNLSDEAAAILAIDDTFYRAICGMLLCDHLFGDTGSPPHAAVDRRVGRACDYVMANLNRRITLTDLESVSGLSARNLQYGFQKQFACSPVTWIRNERLNAVRDLLRAPDDTTSVTAAASLFGFYNLGSFSKFYWKKFGEYPSETLASARARMG
ncbi:helix-turn-helix transcriptional regulator [Xanthobacter sediminis]